MRGQVLKADSVEGLGLILGDDGVRYNFSQTQVRDNHRLVQGHVVDFIGMGDEARDIYLLQSGGPKAPQPAHTPPNPAYAPAAPYAAQKLARKSDGIWTYFLRAISKNYFKFNGRARRQEYWGYILFSILVFILAFFLDILLTLSVFGLEDSEGYFLPLFTALWILYTIIPGISVSVRRFHDQDLSGWMYLLNLIPYVGGLIVLVFMLIDSRAEANVHGPSPKYGAQSTADTFV
jgi:uncharacterized membrane protein YhaH (DUF805 family)